MTDAPLKLFNSLTRSLEVFEPVHPGEARVYSCGPTVYNYQHVGNMRAYVFADTLGRTLQWKGYKLTHVINITDVGHLTSDADEGEDKMERMAAREGKSAWDIAKFYQEDFERDLARLNVQPKQHPRATEYVAAMIEWGKGIADKHCYELDSGLYFDVSTVADYGRLARAVTEDGEGRIESVEGKRNAADFAIWRKTPAGETRQMEWDSPWGRGAPGWHLECSVMGEALLGFPFDIHTGGIDHREIHHPNEIAQNQAYCCTAKDSGGLSETANSGAKIWMHNNFLIDRTKGDGAGKMSKSSGEFLRLQTLVDRGYHPLAYRLLCLQAHYRSELEFSWEGLGAALTRLKRMVVQLEKVRGSVELHSLERSGMLNEDDVVEQFGPDIGELYQDFASFVSNDLNTSAGLVAVERALNVAVGKGDEAGKAVLAALGMDQVLGLGLGSLTRADLRIRPKTATVTEDEIEAALARRKDARSAKDFAASDAIRDELIAAGVEVMDGDLLGWDWKLA